MPIKKLKIVFKELDNGMAANTNGPTRFHTQKSLRVSQERCIFVCFVGKVAWSFFRQILQFCFVFNYEQESLFPQTLNICTL